VTLVKPYAGYLFDLDGTLIDTAPDLHQALLATLTNFGFAPVEEHLTRHWIGHGAKAMIEQALAHQNQSAGNADMDTLWEYFLRAYEANIAVSSRPYPSVVATLTTLRERGAKLAVVTNKIESLSARILQELNLDQIFDALVGGDTAAQPKPAADPAHHACMLIGLQASEVLFVGDSTTDVGCARAADCDVVCVPYGYNHGVDPADLGADAIIDSFDDLV
jgi:phosphoglycolate phosphatase